MKILFSYYLIYFYKIVHSIIRQEFGKMKILTKTRRKIFLEILKNFQPKQNTSMKIINIKKNYK